MKLRKGLFADIDGTLIRWIFFDRWVRASVEGGLFKPYILFELDYLLAKYKAREIRFGEYEAAMVKSVGKEGALRGNHEASMKEVCIKLARDMRTNIHVITKDLIAAAHECGYFIAFVSGSPTIALRCLAEHFPGVEACVGTELLMEGDRYTGLMDDFVVNNKGIAIEKLASEHSIDLSRSIAIGDSPSDSRMFEKVGYPIILNPNTRLDQIATQNHWPIVTEIKKVSVLAYSEGIIGYVRSNLFDILPSEIAELLFARLEAQEFI